MSEVALSIVIPVFNGEGWIGRCIEHLARAVQRAGIERAELIVVDDGSTDGTVSEVQNAPWPVEPEVVVLSQRNQGRLAARTSGLEVATGEMVLFIDTRVFLDVEALAYVMPLLRDSSSRVWTAHTVANTDLSPIAGFWQAIEHVAWRRYWKSPRRLTFGLTDFDYYPKGTTALLAPREALVDAFANYTPTVDDLHISNDDTAVLRWVAERHGISIAPGYSCVYNSRTTLRAFLQHARHRGAVLIDGYLRPGARFSGGIVVVLAMSPVAGLVALRRPRWIGPMAVVLSVGAGGSARALGARPKDSVVFGALSVPFGIFYLAGMWRGFIARLRVRRP
jgi:hypothetical protein